MDIERILAGRGSTQVITCACSASVREAVALLAEKRIGALPIMDGERVAGIFSERDVVYRLASEGESCLDRTVGEVMTSPAITVTRRTAADEALSMMTRRRIRHLPVVDEERMCGFVSIGDLVKSKIDAVEHEAEAMRTYIRTA